MNLRVLAAIFRRDFVSYFSNPTGYVFICVFVVLSSLAAFWPPGFFSNNLANLDQLNEWLPFIMLVFIPAITMSIWAEERRQGTDELLLTLPASDLDVVLGKYFAGVAIYSVSLLFSMFAIFLVFSWGLGQPDAGLFLATYVGYWFIGLAMLAVGMVASFLTDNLTVGFILGTIFNLPLALFGVADWIVKDPQYAQAVKRWSALEQFGDFARGVVSFSGMSYFILIAAVMLYVCMVLIGRRHWSSREGSSAMAMHYATRALALVILAAGVNVLASQHTFFRFDMTSEKLNSLSPKTVELLEEIRDNSDVKTIKIDAYVSPSVPAEFAAHKLNLLSTLEELRSLSGGKIRVSVHEIETFSQDATLAERTYGIELREVATITRGARSRQNIYLGVAITSGLDKVVIPFIDRGIPIEYELIRSIATVAEQDRKTLGVLKTDAQLFGGFTMQGQVQESQLVRELKKQYNVVEVDPANPIRQQYDVLLAVQPSSLTPEAMGHFVEAVKSGQPTAIFEDPFPLPQLIGDVVGTAQPKRPPGGMMGMFGGAQPEPKGDIEQLWQLLGVEMDGDQIIWQDFNPEPRAGDMVDPEWIFIDEGLTAQGVLRPFNPDNSISEGMRQVLFLLAGSFRPADNTKLEFQDLAITGSNSGTISYRDYENTLRSGGMLELRRVRTNQSYAVAAHITGKITPEEDIFISGISGQDADGDSADDKAGQAPEQVDINVVLVADIDWIAPVIFRLREMGENEDLLIEFRFQNVAFVLNILDALAGDQRFIDIRKRSKSHRILTGVEQATEDHREKALKEQTSFINDTRMQIEEAQRGVADSIAKIDNRTDLSPAALEQLKEREEITLNRVLNVKIKRLEDQRDAKIRESERELAAKVRGVQNKYKLYAVLLPPILPIMLAFYVLFRRRQAEQEGVDMRRLRFGGPSPQNTHSNKPVAASRE